MFFGSADISVRLLSVLELYWKSTNANASGRPYHALSFRKTGGAEFEFKNGSVRVNAGELVFVPAFREYRITSGAEKLTVVHFSAEEKLPENIIKFAPENPKYFEQKLDEMFMLWTKKQPGYDHACKSILYKIFYEIEKECAIVAKNDDKISEAVGYIHENFSSGELNIASLAEMCGMSDTYFRKLFKQATNTTPLKYINKLRAEYAAELLKSKYYTVGEVSDKCGFDNVYYFSLFIKKETGLTPSEHIRRINA